MGPLMLLTAVSTSAPQRYIKIQNSKFKIQIFFTLIQIASSEPAIIFFAIRSLRGHNFAEQNNIPIFALHSVRDAYI